MEILEIPEILQEVIISINFFLIPIKDRKVKAQVSRDLSRRALHGFHKNSAHSRDKP